MLCQEYQSSNLVIVSVILHGLAIISCFKMNCSLKYSQKKAKNKNTANNFHSETTLAELANLAHLRQSIPREITGQPK